MEIRDFLLMIPVLLFSVIVHEVAHGWVARREGDPTAAMLGRLTLNPLPHIDPIGSILLPLVLYYSHAGFLFGWAKPVPVDPRNFRHYRRSDILVSLAGIVSNLLLALAFTLLALLTTQLAGWAPSWVGLLAPLQLMAANGISINLMLAFFNLIPIPPLDGSHVVYHLLPPRLGWRYQQAGRYGMLVIMAIMFFAPELFRHLLWPVMFLRNQAFGLITPLS